MNYLLLWFVFCFPVSFYGMKSDSDRESEQKKKDDTLKSVLTINKVKKIVDSYSAFLFKCSKTPYLRILHPIIGCTRNDEEEFSGTRALLPSLLGNSKCDGSVQNFTYVFPESFNKFSFEARSFYKTLNFFTKIRMNFSLKILMKMSELLPPVYGGFFDTFVTLQQQQREAFLKLFTIVPVALLDSKRMSYYANGPTGCRFFTTEKKGEVFFSVVIHCGC